MSSIDLSQFIDTFLEESREGLDLIESTLLDLDSLDQEQVHSVFRAAHSIKGGAGTFGFQAVSDFTHNVETLLDEVRSERKTLTTPLVDLLLESVDCIRTLLAENDNPDLDRSVIDQVQIKLAEAVAAGSEPDSTSNPGDVEGSSESLAAMAQQGWQIQFAPHADMMRNGNEPLFMLEALAELGDLSVIANIDSLPTLEELNPEQLSLSWSMTLISDCLQDDVQEVFEWVEDECDLDIQSWTRDLENTSESVVEPDVSEKTPVLAAVTSTEGAPRAVKNTAKSDASSIRVSTDKVDSLINRTGELVITQAMLGQISEELAREGVTGVAFERLQEGLALLERNTRDLQEDVMRVRMLPISFVFSRFPRLVHDVSAKLGKKVNLIIQGEQTEIDKTVMEKIGDPLVHLIRNALDHGLETPEERLAQGKDETGTLTLNAYHRGSHIVIDIDDDGRGLNAERIRQKALENGLLDDSRELTDDMVYELIFAAGFSTADSVSDLSGRGVGMDVVRRNIEALGGFVSVRSEAGKGAGFSVSLPLTLAILDGQLIRVAEEVFVIPLVAIVETLCVPAEKLNHYGGDDRLLPYRGEYLPVLPLASLFGGDSQTLSTRNPVLISVVESGGQRVGLVLDELEGQQQVVIKSLETNLNRVEGFSGATILGNGRVALILDVTGLIKKGMEVSKRAHIARSA